MAYPSPFTIIKSSELQVNELYVLFNRWTDSIICVKITDIKDKGIIRYINIADGTLTEVDWDNNDFGVFHLSKSQQKGGTKR